MSHWDEGSERFKRFQGSDSDKFKSAMPDVTYDQNDGERMAERLERWEAYRVEMLRHQIELAKLAVNYLELDAYQAAGECAYKAEGIKYVLGRMPNLTP